MQKLFNPKTVAIIGASANPIKWGNWLAEEVVRHIDKRRVYFVNPKKEIIFGIPSLSRVDHIPEPIELAIVAVNSDLFEEAVDDLLRHGTDIIIGITSNVNLDVQQRVAEKIRLKGSRLIGPNCAGLWSEDFECMPIGEFTLGPVGMISQSGGILVDVSDRLKEIGLGFSKAISIGNQIDTSFVDILPILEKDSKTKIVILYVENTDSIPYTYIGSMTKPVLILSPNATPMAVQAAKQHTNSLLTTHRTGLEIESLADLVATIQMKLNNRQANGNRMAVVTDTGGVGVMICSFAERLELCVESYTDLVGIPSAFSEKTCNLLRDLIDSKSVDAILMNLHLYNDYYDESLYANVLAELIQSSKKLVIFSCRSFSNP